MKRIKRSWYILLSLFAISSNGMAKQSRSLETLRVATFNVSMEALNYIDRKAPPQAQVTGNELLTALKSNHQQIRNIAEIIQRVNPDIILLNEFDHTNESNQAIELFISKYLAVSQHGQQAISFPYYYLPSVNTGVKTPFDLNNDGKIEQPADTYGFGYFPGHFGMVLLSKYPIDINRVRSFQTFKWKDMPNALQPIDPQTNQPWYNAQAWQDMRLSSKSHIDLPVNVNGHSIHLLASHPTPPVFDGPEDRNGKRNHDEIRFWHDYLSPEASQYIYDDAHQKGGIKDSNPFIILGDQNASATEGDAINNGIESLLNHNNIQDPMPSSEGSQQHSPENPLAKHHTAYWRMRADYVLPSKQGFKILGSGIFWPTQQSDEFRLIENRQASSDHRLVWVDLQLTK